MTKHINIKKRFMTSKLSWKIMIALSFLNTDFIHENEFNCLCCNSFTSLSSQACLITTVCQPWALQSTWTILSPLLGYKRHPFFMISNHTSGLAVNAWNVDWKDMLVPVMGYPCEKSKAALHLQQRKESK